MKRSVIAEIGINHDGDLGKAKRLILAASISGCAGIKFQYRNISRAYAENANEIGDEIILTQLKLTNISSSDIVLLRDYARMLGLQAGISFFTIDDVQDFLFSGLDFDFFKIPSAEMMNLELIQFLINTGKMLYISVGMHSEAEIETVFSGISEFNNWIPMHCISNYPVVDHNVSLGYISHLKERWGRPVGYSSHDDNWENNIVALTLGAEVIERHITESRSDSGLDHSSSSTPLEFESLCKFAVTIDSMLVGDGPRVPNQGELLNKQNLGRSFYAKRNLSKGSVIEMQDFDYRSPQTGLDINSMRKVLGQKITSDLIQGSSITKLHIQSTILDVDNEALENARKFKISLPVRLNDYEEISTKLPINTFEFHLSYKEVESNLESFKLNADHKYSVHLPDYIDSSNLIDPFSEIAEIRQKSAECIQKVINFSEKIASLTGERVPIVASLAGINMSRENFYPAVDELFSKTSTQAALLTLQWLPPYAWYFGGSIKLGVMNSIEDIYWIKKFKVPVTLDTSHLLLGKNAFGFDPWEVVDSIQENIVHWHISDALGLDGEGMPIGAGGKQNERFIWDVVHRQGIKVIEVWQGHFANYQGFKTEINKIYSMEQPL